MPLAVALLLSAMATGAMVVLGVLWRVRTRRAGDPLAPSAAAALLGCAGLLSASAFPQVHDLLTFTAAATLTIAMAGLGTAWLSKERR